ncbi:MAG: hypothetical protein SFV81_07400 [Pirellulaceae bacterium]|nr:hypothetical protein [Pirellulaceae bacterium]
MNKLLLLSASMAARRSHPADATHPSRSHPADATYQNPSHPADATYQNSSHPADATYQNRTASRSQAHAWERTALEALPGVCDK